VRSRLLIVAGVCACKNVVVTCIWLIDKGDLCDTCRFRAKCPDQSRCLHLVASAGNLEAHPQDLTPTDLAFGRLLAAEINARQPWLRCTAVETTASLANIVAVLPITNFAEEEGTFTNLRGRVQRFLQAKAAPGLARPSWFVLSDLLGALGESANYFLPADVFAALAASHPEFAGLTYDRIGLRGLPVINAAQPAGAAQ